jgi:predicted O-methyltransferase YrrM
MGLRTILKLGNAWRTSMKPDEVKEVVGDLPHMTLEQGKTVSNFIRQHRVKNILELGFRYGVSTLLHGRSAWRARWWFDHYD